MAQRNIVQRGVLCAVALTSLAACSTVNFEPDRIDYKSANKAAKPQTLDVPPDLTQLQHDSRYQIPDSAKGTISATEYNAKQGQTAAAPQNQTVAVTAAGGMHIERDGNQRWLVVKQSPEVLWPQVKEFWQESGFLINIDQPAEGVMETDWAENRGKIAGDFLRDTLGKVMDSLWDTGERDKFRTRFERSADGTTEIYISHRGAEQVVTGAQKEGLAWTPRPSDPGLEAVFLTRLMARLSNEPALAAKSGAATAAEQQHAKLVTGPNGGYVEVDEGFDRAWRRVGLALDRVGFTVEDRDRSQGLYFVRYVNEVKDAKTERGWFTQLFSFGSDKPVPAAKYRVSVKENGATSRIVVFDSDGKPETSGAGEKILGLLNNQLK